nr:DNA polymerase III subunit epsilon [Candidatus Synchoanobacter obligatus]
MIFVDTETTGISRKTERILEVACIEVDNRHRTGRQLHQYINPEKAVEAGAFKVHGISWEKVKHEPVFADVAESIIDMLKGGVFVAHNAPFDMGFLNEEFKRAGFDFQIGRDVEVLDTLKLAKEMYPGQKNSLDALCNRLSIDRSSRVLHGALLDTELLIQVYIAMTQKQERFAYAGKKDQHKSLRPVSYHACVLDDDEARAHDEYISALR